MLYRKLGKTNLHVSVIGVGTWQFGGEWGTDFSHEQADAVLGAAREYGINLIDTAECYGDHLSEQLIGRAVMRDRTKWILATKFGHRFRGYLDREQRWSPPEVQRQLEDSLRSLRTDYIDLYQFHSGDNGVFDNDELWTMLNRQKRAGKIRHLGISISNSYDDVLEHQSARASAVGAEVLQIYYNRLDRRPEKDIFDRCRRLDLGVLARVPLASGFLSGKYRKGDLFSERDVRSSKTPEQIETILGEVDWIRDKEVPAGIDMSRWALAWCLRDPVVTAVIPGCRNPDQMRSNASAAELVRI